MLRRQFFRGIYSVFCTSHIPKATCNIAPKIQKFSYHAGKPRFFFTRMHPRRHAQEAIFPVIYNVFLHLSNADFDPQKSANHPPQRAVFTVIYSVFGTFPTPKSPCPPHPPMAPYVGRSWFLCWAILALSWGHLGTMLGIVGSSWAYVGPAWDYVGRSWVLCWASFVKALK